MSYNFSNSLFGEELEREQVRLLYGKEENNRIGSKEDSRDRDRDRSRERNYRLIRDGEKDRRFNEEDPRRFDNSRLRSPQQLMTQYEDSSVVRTATKHTGENGLISVLKHLLILESRLGSLGSKAVGLLSEALYMEKSSQGSADILVSREEIFFETFREKLIGLLEVGFMDQTLSRIADIVVQKISYLLSIHKSGKSSGPSNERDRDIIEMKDKRSNNYSMSMKSAENVTVEKQAVSTTTSKLGKLCGAGRKRMKWLISQGYSRAEARVQAVQKIKRRQSAKTTNSECRLAKKPREHFEAQSPNSEAEQTTTPTYGQVTAGVRIGFLAEDFPETLLTVSQTNLVQKEILAEVLQQREGLKPKFLGVIPKPGYLIFICSNEETANWLKNIAKKLKPWENAALKAVSEGEISLAQVATAYFPNSGYDSNETILHYLKVQNDGLHVDQWKVLRREQESFLMTLLVLSVDVMTASKLKRDGLKLSYKFGEIQLRLKGKHDLPPKVTKATMVKALPPGSSIPGSLAEGSSESVAVPGGGSDAETSSQPTPLDSCHCIAD